MASNTQVFYTLFEIDSDGDKDIIDSSSNVEYLEKIIQARANRTFEIVKSVRVTTDSTHSTYSPEAGLKTAPVIDYAGFGDD